MKRVVPMHDDLFDFFYEALPGYEAVGRRRVLLACWGAFQDPVACNFQYKDMTAWGRIGQSDPAARALLQSVRSLWDEQLPDEEWVLRFLQTVGTDAAALPPEVAAALVPLTPLVRRGRPIWQTELPLAELAAPRESNVSAVVSADGEGALTSRLLQSAIHALELYSIYLGKELGLYAALGSGESVTPPELALRAGIAPRYAREWLEQQAVAGFLEVDMPLAEADARAFRLPPAHVNVLVTEYHPAHLAPLAQMVAGIGGAIEPVLAAYRTGGGVPYPGAAFRKGQAGINRPAFAKDLVERWIPAAADIHARLPSSRLRVADVGCGAGWSTIAMAQAFPQAEVIGFDADEASVTDARQNAAAQQVAVRFEVRDAYRRRPRRSRATATSSHSSTN